jgi:hypothetical protein
MNSQEFECIIKIVEKALNENAGHRINEYTGTGILNIIARQVGELVDKEPEVVE